MHLLLAFISLFFLLNISISGSLLVFAKEIQQFLQPERWLVTPQRQTLSLSQLVKQIEKFGNEKI